jgi:hypothetical protein
MVQAQMRAPPRDIETRVDQNGGQEELREAGGRGPYRGPGESAEK